MRKPKHSELMGRLGSDALEFLEVFQRANEDMVERGQKQGLALDYDDSEDTLTITIGQRPADFFTQGVGVIYFDIDLETDKVIGFTIHDFQEVFVKTKDGGRIFRDITPTLLAYGSITFPPEREGTHKVAEGFRELVPV